MLNFKTIGKYKISSVRSSNDNISVYVGFIGDVSSKETFIINELKYEEKNKKLFKELFLYFQSKEKIELFRDFFSLNGYFYVVFDYFDEQNIIYKYRKQTCTSNFNERVKIFESLCIRISSYFSKRIPAIILNCSLSPKNIVINEEHDVFFNFDMSLSYPNIDYEIYIDNKDIIKKIYNIFKIFFDIEISSKYNHVMKFILQKCEIGFYKLIPEIVVDLKNRYGEASISSFMQFWKYQFKVRKKMIIRYINTLFIFVILIVLGMVIFNKVQSNFRSNMKNHGLSIGTISYSSSSDASSDNSLFISGPSMETSLESKNNKLIIPKGTDIDYEDYILKNNDTLNSISEQYYGDKSFSSVITSFNELSGYLIPGSIIKLPIKSAVCKNEK